MKIRKQNEIMSSWSSSFDQPLVSILCVTYNHVDYIERAIQGFLLQETTFPFEILIHDDASSDGTTDIVMRYAKEYPDLIRVVIQEHNQYSHGHHPQSFLYPLVRGRYKAICEGDDYWTDPLKLQIQCDYLEKNKDVAVSSHDAYTVDTSGKVLVKSRLPDKHKRDYSAGDLMSGRAWFLLQNVVYRNVDVANIPEIRMISNGDVFLIAVLGSLGGSHYHPEIKPSCHIRHPGGVWSGLGVAAREEAQINSWFWIYKYLKRTGNDHYARIYWGRYLRKVFAYSPLAALIKEFLIKIFCLRDIYAQVKRLKP